MTALLSPIRMDSRRGGQQGCGRLLFVAMLFLGFWQAVASTSALAQTNAVKPAINTQNFNSLDAGINAALAAGDYAQAQTLTMQLKQLAEQSNQPRYLASAEGYFGVLARRRGDLQNAVSHHERAIAIRREIGDQEGIATSLTNLGTVYRDLGQYSQSLLSQLDAIDIRQQLGAEQRLDVNYRNIGLLYSDVEDFETAKKFMELAEQEVRKAKTDGDLAPVLGSFASLLNDMGDYALALGKVEEAFKIDSPSNHLYGVSQEHVEFARAYLGMDRDPEAKQHVEAAIIAANQIGQADVLGRAQLLRGILMSRAGQIDPSIQELKAATALLEKHGLKRWALLGLKTLSLAHEKKGDLQAALDSQRRAETLREQILGLNAARRLGALESQREREREKAEYERRLMSEQISTTKERNRKIVFGLALGMLGALAFALLTSARRNRDLRRSHQEVIGQQTQLAQVNRRLRDQTEELRRAAVTDALTGVYNRRYAIDQLALSIQEARVNAQDLAVLVIDLDRFKQVNDRFGHHVGDLVLTSATQFLAQNLRNKDVLARMGGEEFIVILPDTTRMPAEQIAERLRASIEKNLHVVDGRSIDVTASIGVVMLSTMPEQVTVDQLVDAADAAMYHAKRSRRNAVHFHGD